MKAVATVTTRVMVMRVVVVMKDDEPIGKKVNEYVRITSTELEPGHISHPRFDSYRFSTMVENSQEYRL